MPPVNLYLSVRHYRQNTRPSPGTAAGQRRYYRARIPAMLNHGEPSCGPTARTIARTTSLLRQAAGLSREELSARLIANSAPATSTALAGIEDGLIPATADDLTALAYALETSPDVLIGHTSDTPRPPDEPLATGLPRNVSAHELRLWSAGRITLDTASRLAWYESRLAMLTAAKTHYLDQLSGIHSEVAALERNLEQQERHTSAFYDDSETSGDDPDLEKALASARERIAQLRYLTSTAQRDLAASQVAIAVAQDRHENIKASLTGTA